MPVHGNAGSLIGFHMEKNAAGTRASSPLQPPTACSPITASTAEPMISTTACITSV